MSKIIQFEHWPRYNHFKAFSTMESPHLTVAFNIDIKPLLKLKSSKSLFSTILFLLHRSCEEIPEFKYRILKDGSVIVYDQLDISFNILAKDELFSNHRMGPIYQFEDFHAAVKLAIEAKSKNGQIQIDPNQEQNLIVTSYIPWFSFIGLREPLIDKNDSIPRITWGKCSADGQMPVSIQAHHGLMDGFHLGKFYEISNEKILTFSK